MSAKYLLGTVAGIAVFVFGAAWYLQAPKALIGEPADLVATTTASAATTTEATTTARKPASKPITNPAPAPKPTPAPAPAPTPQGYTLAQVAAHNSASSCWTAINGKVYDVTSWIHQHPGGAAAILSLCGRDGSAAFNDQHGGQRRPEQELASFYVAALI
jgi:cytochrome b involved in lipid metabolism